MIKMIVSAVSVIAITIIAGIYPIVAVMVTAIIITTLFLIFGKE